MSVRSEVVRLLDPLLEGRVSSDNEPRGGFRHPYVLVSDALFENPGLKGDRRVMAWRRTFQVDLFELLQDEDPLLLDMVLAVIDGATAEGTTHLAVQGVVRVPEPEPAAGTVHHAITCTVARPRG